MYHSKSIESVIINRMKMERRGKREKEERGERREDQKNGKDEKKRVLNATTV
jgi:hypothetical protein